ncbi:SWI/SNF family helicase [Azoarcus olearius]|uniref:DEAD/DEAH box helicase n=1 Tax=Azoarcus sp. (strain BH72) TaxID=418699 RepID=UPI0008062DDB|nr:DEAD/DEAH box helicase [Azoarcus olearius]ANQ83978.1 SWI/SNF family helicase [Azoarcus olearius]
MKSPDSYTEADVIAWLGQHEVDKGRAYLAAVTQLERKGDILHARVRGSRTTPYQVSAQVRSDPWRGTFLLSHCSCPLGDSCKHVAATLLSWLARRDGPERPRDQVLAWIDAFRSAAGQAPTAAGEPRRAAPSVHALRYLIHDQADVQDYVVSCHKVRLDRQGQIRSAEGWSNFERAFEAPPAFVDEVDLDILGLLWSQRPRTRYLPYALPLAGRNAAALMERLVASGRAHLDTLESPPLQVGEPRPGVPEWRTTREGLRAPGLRLTPPADRVLPLSPPWYVERATGVAGPVTLELPAEQVVRLLALPPLTPTEAELVADTLHDVAPQLPAPLATGEPPLRLDGAPLPVLRIATLPVIGVDYRDYPGYSVNRFDYATLAFRYGPLTVEAADTALFHVLDDGRSARLTRDRAAEAAAARRLTQSGFGKVPAHAVHTGHGATPPHMLGLASEADWVHFTAEDIPALRREGWVVDMPEDFRHHALDIDELLLDVDEQGGWLDISPGIEVEGRRVSLAPLLAELFAQDPRWLSGGLERIADSEPIILHHDILGRLRLPAGRLKSLVRALVDLFDNATGEHMRVSPLDAGRLAALQLPGRGADTLAAYARRLRDATGIEAVPQPKGFKAELRPYQLEGLAWLQHLVRNNLAGILADDMGLGKTAQTLAHLLALKHAGKLDRPALVVLPTSLVFNWQAEAERFAPELRVLKLHGADRHGLFEQLEPGKRKPRVDVAITTYPLLWRDEEELQAREWSILILDEAQTVKNVASKGAQVIRQLKARHRLGLTGTPLENHLGELWAQFDFLLPGFLGDAKHFTKTWRTPIEKHGDTVRRDLLAARLRPFILRRRKEDVATELPPKTIIVRSVALEGGQRDLYETVRAAMDSKIRDEIAAKGYARSQIVILDALLKLRQVCCDPRLLKTTAAAAKVKERAKLDLLMSMLPELIDEGRRILVFSQFTQMLALIAAELDKAKIGWVALTGDTRDRRIPVEDFQKGRAPVFLISLKAGGVGLNLTTADTVIHYDPWWNPAAENQATDRAHRIGQDKPVFVFKLICAGSIEERILSLQDKKAALAASVLSEDANALAKFGEADIAALLAPLPPG